MGTLKKERFNHPVQNEPASDLAHGYTQYEGPNSVIQSGRNLDAWKPFHYCIDTLICIATNKANTLKTNFLYSYNDKASTGKSDSK